MRSTTGEIRRQSRGGRSTSKVRWTAGLAAAVLAVGGATFTQPAAAGATLPHFSYGGQITVPDQLDYNPTGEFIFPSVFHAGKYLANPLGEWYLYYAPHENPGGISFMYADSPKGPWKEYKANPVVANVWSPHYAVPHVSSPDVIWNKAAKKVFLYFHGDNGVTRYATSTDGATFTYGGVAVDNSMTGPEATETSYARVFEHPDPRSRYTYAMFYMENTTANIRRIRLAESVDGKAWHVRPKPFLEPVAGETNVSAGNLYKRDGRLYITYHASNGISYARTVDRQLTRVGSRQMFHEASGTGEDVGRVAAPDIAVEGGKTYLFYESGDRLNATIRYAVAED